ncbi:hypothetical protein F4808DRAFT_462438 [Astrocystis sublimbata]|nr:hypothetical protein F4808DRAFT_462438 [Astrocystis sublimbata]
MDRSSSDIELPLSSASGTNSKSIPRTHDTSLASSHITFLDWAGQMNNAVTATSAKNYKSYSEIKVLMICWEEEYDGALACEFRQLSSVFETVYQCSVIPYHLPLTDPDFALMKIIFDLIEEHGKPENLLIVYYVGFATPDSYGTRLPVWEPRSNPGQKEEVNTNIFHHLLARACDDSPDVVLLYDCGVGLLSPKPNGNSSGGEVEALFAGSFESHIPISGPDSFTKHLITSSTSHLRTFKQLPTFNIHLQISY